MKKLILIDFYEMIYFAIPISIVWFIYLQWTKDKITIGYALFRMIIQLVFIGYLLVYIFSSNSSIVVMLILTVMLIVASSISIRTLKSKSKKLYLLAAFCIAISLLINLSIVTQAVLKITPWFNPTYTIPLAGMIFSVSINAITLASERYESEIVSKSHTKSRAVAIKSALTPVINSLFAVGAVSLPGLMTGEILSGVDPLIAVRYQILIMLMLFSSASISAMLYLYLVEKLKFK